MVSEAQRRAIRKYKTKHPEQTKHTNAKSAAKSFVKRYATLDELKWLKDVIAEQERVLQSTKN